ncbi:MAG: hypothetical protein AEth_01795 [Candidatus Argoarchaeum ethanivorans]|uniref:Dockerin domain-containing protein n=1 Tax=Candidatus Argoarchaeum ethanivorans TaxID=2608793 RepID=A0A8B3RZY2_9EURY|nr:MAG: hypothetical protein AEth_01795 [Candidatus Argoarchaeum ethanivorans]
MKNKRNIFWNVSVFALLFAALAVISIGCASADTIYVPEEGNQTIQQAVNNASEGDTIIVRDAYTGTKENIDVTVAYLTIQSENGSANCIVNALNSNDHVFDVQQNYVNVTGFTVENATKNDKAGIHLDSVEHCNISYTNASNNGCGIWLYYSSNNILTNNTANSNTRNGIYLSSSSNNTLTNNTASNNNGGICLSSSSNNTLTNNIMSENNYNFDVDGSILSHYTHSIDTSNLVDGEPIYYWIDQQNKEVPGDAGFVGLVNSTNITVKDLTLTNNQQGVLLAYTKNSRIERINASNNNWAGILLYSSSNNTLTNNTASNNIYGIYLQSSSNNNMLTNNTASSNTRYNIHLYYSSNNNLFYHNNLINNPNHNAYDTGTNQWNTSTVGNYYSDYTGSDNNSDGIGETSYPIPGGSSIDCFPLMHPWKEIPPLKGDLDGDFQITSTDAAIVLEIAVGSRPCTPETLAIADVSGDGRVSSLDALMILQMVT